MKTMSKEIKRDIELDEAKDDAMDTICETIGNRLNRTSFDSDCDLMDARDELNDAIKDYEMVDKCNDVKKVNEITKKYQKTYRKA